MTVNVALLGAGRIGKVHARSMRMDPRSTLVAVADAQPDAARALAAETGAQVRSVEAVLDDPAIAAVLIATSTDTHVDLIDRALARGKAVLCEKPVDQDLARAQACAKRVAASDCPVMIGFNRRFDSNFMALKQAFDRGEVGRAELLSITSFDPAPPPLDYIKVSGGQFRDQTIHDFDIVCWLLGLPERVTAVGSCLVDPAIGEAGDIDTSVVVLTYADGRIATIRNTRRASYGYDQRIELLGSEGLLQVDNVRENTLVKATAEGIVSANPLYFFLERYMQAFETEWSRFLDVVIDGAAVPVTVSDGVNALRLAEAARTALVEGRSVRV